MSRGHTLDVAFFRISLKKNPFHHLFDVNPYIEYLDCSDALNDKISQKTIEEVTPYRHLRALLI